MMSRLSPSWIRLLVCVLILAFGLTSLAEAKPKKKSTRRGRTSSQRTRKPVEPYASALVIEAETGRILFTKNPDSPRAPASLAKMMTELLTLEAAERGIISLEDTVTIPPSVGGLRGSRIRLVPGEGVTVSELLRAAAIASANDAAHALACHLAGSEEAFVQLMNARAGELGMRATRYMNPHGLDRGDRLGSTTTARDQAILARELLRHDLALRFACTQVDTIRGAQIIRTTNRLLGVCEGVDGLKTGYTRKAGYCLVSTAEREGMRVISVLLGGASSRRRFSESSGLLAQAFERYQKVPVVQRGQDLGQACATIDGHVSQVRLVAGEDVALLLPTREQGPIHLEVDAPRTVAPPIRRGTSIGLLRVLVGDSLAAAVPAVAARDVRPAGVIDRLGQSLGWVD